MFSDQILCFKSSKTQTNQLPDGKSIASTIMTFNIYLFFKDDYNI